MHCSREGHDRVEMQLVEEDSASGTRIYQCPKCGWEGKQFGRIPASPEPRRAPPKEPAKASPAKPPPPEPPTPRQKARAVTLERGSGDKKQRGTVIPVAIFGLFVAAMVATIISRDEDDSSDLTCDFEHPDACFHLGVMNEYGVDADMDVALAASFYQTACDGGHGEACSALGKMYVDGVGVPENQGRAATLYDKACSAGDHEGCANAGYMYFAGEGVAQDFISAASLYKRGCDAGSGIACAYLADMYEEGTGVTQDSAFAAELRRQACSRGVTSTVECP